MNPVRPCSRGPAAQGGLPGEGLRQGGPSRGNPGLPKVAGEPRRPGVMQVLCHASCAHAVPSDVCATCQIRFWSCHQALSSSLSRALLQMRSGPSRTGRWPSRGTQRCLSVRHRPRSCPSLPTMGELLSGVSHCMKLSVAFLTQHTMCRRLTPEEAAASKESLEQVAPDSSLVQTIMEAFLERTAPTAEAPQVVTGNPEGG